MALNDKMQFSKILREKLDAIKQKEQQLAELDRQLDNALDQLDAREKELDALIQIRTQDLSSIKPGALMQLADPIQKVVIRSQKSNDEIRALRKGQIDQALSTL